MLLSALQDLFMICLSLCFRVACFVCFTVFIYHLFQSMVRVACLMSALQYLFIICLSLWSV